MKAILSNRIYMEVPREYAEFIREKLTYRIENYANPLEPILMKTFSVIRYAEDKVLITIPIGRTDLIPEDYQIIDKRVLNETQYPDFNGVLRDSQQRVWDEIDDNAIINAKVSWGKTFTALAIASKLGQRCLIVTHTVPLRNQWARETAKAFGIEPSIIGSGKFSTAGPITIGNVQSLYGCMDQICKEFGTIIMDEMHHVSAPTFTRVIDKSYARYKIGLSGTIRRKDGKHVVFKDYFGNKVYTPPKENSLDPVIDVVSPGIYLPEGPSLGWAARVTLLMESPAYREFVCALSNWYADKGHQVLTVSDRVDFLEHCARQTAGACITGKNADDREQLLVDLTNGVYNKLYATQSIFSEGMSHDPLSALILGTPVNNEPLLEQLIGRIQRPVPGKLQPRVADIRLQGFTPERQFQARLGHYMRQGYKVNYL
jgi:superfamily II DNA or RNA helicase